MNVSGTRKIDGLTSLRFFAAALVVFGHGMKTFGISIHVFDLRNAVSFFFVLSGFVLVHSYGTINAKKDYWTFLSARISRLWPAYAFTGLIAILALTPINTAYDFLRAVVNLLMLQSLVPSSWFYFSFNGVAWSVSAEMIFYLAFPFALLLLRRSFWYLLGVAALVVVANVSVAAMADMSVSEGVPVSAWGLLYISPLCRVAEFFIGMAAYPLATRFVSALKGLDVVRATTLEAAVLAAMVAGMVFTAWLARSVLWTSHPQLALWILVTGPTVIFAASLVVFFAERGFVSRVLGFRPLVYLGEISFSLYLLHQLVLRVMLAYFDPWLKANLMTAYAAYWLISIVGAALIFEFIERPFRSPLRSFLNRRVFGGPSARAA
ncbi:acyltransferase [Achromobacter sp. ACM05]|uniref:acyltransferase family protein n=1 Tax=Achromobacter sp. ACM05 TaxID=2854776 RepID=UPI001C443588|nr:acyltransferase [Achromobacter sp. ACM05]MBV7502113.1 acyltransferase [Achromobacter sp. ACM05]